MYINSDLQNTIDATKAQVLGENLRLAFQGPVKVGAFDITHELARSMLLAANPSGRQNSDVIKPYLNASDIVDRSRNKWMIDFGLLSEQEAALYQAPFAYVVEHVKPEREANRDKQRRTNWWRLGRSGEEYKQAARGLARQIFSPRVAKHRLFVWVGIEVLPDSRVLAITRDDDYFFGVLHSLPHELWSIRLASWHGVGNDPTYNAESCFETFPFPYPPGKEPMDDAQVQAIAAAAKALHEERYAWLNPDESMLEGRSKAQLLKQRTLTNLYNALEKYRAQKSGNGGKRSGTDAAEAFAPRLAELHDALDRAVLEAYEWEDLADKLRTPDGDEELLRRLLALNLARAG
jgi:type II restriction/modification system DNA methylase subunit YeeA